MATAPISVDAIFENIFNRIQQPDNETVVNLGCVDTIVFKNSATQEKFLIKSYQILEKLIVAVSTKQTRCNYKSCNNNSAIANNNLVHVNEIFGVVDADSGGAAASSSKDHVKSIDSHDWCVQGNYFAIKIRPFILQRYYEAVRDSISFSEFVMSNAEEYANKTESAGDYVYWPNIEISYFGWRLYLKLKFDIDIGEYVPLPHNRSLGNVNLFVWYPEHFLNVELCMTCNRNTLFVNGHSIFNDSNDTLFTIRMSDGSKGVCKILPKLVYSSKDLFEYIRDDIHLQECVTAPKFSDIVQIDLRSMRVFDDKTFSNYETVKVQKFSPTIIKNITSSSENYELIKNEIDISLDKIKTSMIEGLQNQEGVDGDVLIRYLSESNYFNFDYLIIVVWKMVSRQRFEFCETDIKLYLELLCLALYKNDAESLVKVRARCDPYVQLSTRVYKKFCDSLHFFSMENPCVLLGYYYAIHYCIYLNSLNDDMSFNERWAYTYERVMTCKLPPNVLCLGFLKKLESQGSFYVFNGKHYVPVKKDDELFKVTETGPSVKLSTIKFNNWKYLCFAEQGVFNVFINHYHNSCPFIIGNCLVNPFRYIDENEFLPKETIDYMLNNAKYEMEIFKTYHVAKVCRDIKVIKTNMSIINSFDNCRQCKNAEHSKLNQYFHEIWNSSPNELIIYGIYLNDTKMSDLIKNLRCVECKEAGTTQTSCSCVAQMNVNIKAFKLTLIFELFCDNAQLVELIWCLHYAPETYTKILGAQTNDVIIEKYAPIVYERRLQLIDQLYNKLDTIDIDMLLYEFSSANILLKILTMEDSTVAAIDSNVVVTAADNYDYDDFAKTPKNNCNDDGNSDYISGNSNEQYFDHFYKNYANTIVILRKYSVWWDKLIVARPSDDLAKWLTRFYMRVIMSRIDVKTYSPLFVKQVVRGYLYFRLFTNFNVKNSLLMMHFGASLGIPTDYEKCCIYLNGEPGSGKSSFFDLLESIIVVHKRDADKYTLSKKETDEMEANKLISQLYVINELKECNDSFFKSTADSSKSNSVCRKYQGSQKYEANYKLLVVNNKPLHISDYDRGVRNRFCVVYTDHEFLESMQFNGSIYFHAKNKKYPQEKAYFEDLTKPVRLFLSHILMYKRNPKDGYVYYKEILKSDSIHEHNLKCLDLNNSPLEAIVYILKVKSRPGAKPIDETKVDKAIELAVPFLDKFLHALLRKRNYQKFYETTLCAEFRKAFEKHYRPYDKVFVNLDMSFNKNDFNLNVPSFKC
uniref:Helicase n=1 Tax=Helicoverpa armigera nucleopolyhedrovirus TaxID=51313 RepID=A0A0E3JB86_9ABAC|nr:helicase [Helicoverpa armigera nucleopolyhedrovirus]